MSLILAFWWRGEERVRGRKGRKGRKGRRFDRRMGYIFLLDLNERIVIVRDPN